MRHIVLRRDFGGGNLIYYLVDKKKKEDVSLS